MDLRTQFLSGKNAINACQLPRQAPKPISLNVLELLPWKSQSKEKREDVWECVLLCGLLSSGRSPSRLNVAWIWNHWKHYLFQIFELKTMQIHLQMIIIISIWALIDPPSSHVALTFPSFLVLCWNWSQSFHPMDSGTLYCCENKWLLSHPTLSLTSGLRCLFSFNA